MKAFLLIFFFYTSNLLYAQKVETSPAHSISSQLIQENVSMPKYQVQFETGYSFGIDSYHIDYLKFNAVYDYNIIPNISIGIGSGLREALQVKDALIPFFADFRAHIPIAHRPLYLALEVGYSLDVTSDFKTEGFYFLINPAAGFRIRLTDQTVINIGIGYENQKLKMSYDNYNVPPGSTIQTNGISLNTGILF